ncbi:LCP family protein [Paenibacillus radicis (ex Xue et al. 2023)]|uniref:LCP family protein n=1 Tax=Paenibacillus radicis (ex Xue et al. 2023) TaxID=2972489 RepID=A0ABT1YPZ2_9BACL|nr:LCP family protein [Paenibacillus radicis (ex Xue et al. 2023)]MCR8635251.1 LCP family protein [Paenibacillus radicis (ex Xue et al. 2023)]
MKKMILKIALASAVAIAATVGIYVYSIYETTTVAIEKIGTPEVVPVEQSAKVKPLTLLLMGIDYRPESGSLNSDVIMVVTLNPEQHSATLVSLPRDLQMAPKGLPSRKANYYYPYFNNIEKNSAFMETKKVFSDFMGVPVDYMVTVDFDGFRQIVDLMGGLTIQVDMDMRYVDDEDGTDINLKKGLAKLNGKQTLDFVRYRKSNRNTEESSDLARNQRQQQVLDQLMNSLKSTGGVTKLGQIIETVGSHMKTDVPASQIRDLMTTYFDISPSNVKYVHLDGEWESPYIIVKDEDLEEARAALIQQLGGKGTAIAGIGLSTGSGVGKESTSGTSSSKGSNGGSSGSTSSGGSTGEKSNSSTGTGNGSAAGTKSGAGAGKQKEQEGGTNKETNGTAESGSSTVGEATYGVKSENGSMPPKSPAILPPNAGSSSE